MLEYICLPLYVYFFFSLFPAQLAKKRKQTLSDGGAGRQLGISRHVHKVCTYSSAGQRFTACAIYWYVCYSKHWQLSCGYV